MQVKKNSDSGFVTLPLLLVLVGFVMVGVYVSVVFVYAKNIYEKVDDAALISIQAASALDRTDYATNGKRKYEGTKEARAEVFEANFKKNIGKDLLEKNVVKYNIETFEIEEEKMNVKLKCRIKVPVFGEKEKFYEKAVYLEEK